MRKGGDRWREKTPRVPSALFLAPSFVARPCMNEKNYRSVIGSNGEVRELEVGVITLATRTRAQVADDNISREGSETVCE